MELATVIANPLETIIQFAHTLHTDGDPVVQFLPWYQVEGWLGASEWEKVRFLLRKLPLAIIPETSEFFYVRAHAFWGQHRLEEARKLFEKAHYFYSTTQKNLTLSAASCLEIADIAQSRRHYQEALHYLQIAEILLATEPTVNPYVTARYSIVYAVVLHDLGRLQAAIEFAQAAYIQFETINDAPSQLFCAMAIASAAVQMGQLSLAEGQIAVAHSLFSTNAIPAIYYARILNAEVHFAWHCGDLGQAMAKAMQLHQYASTQDIPHQRLYATVLQGHLQRGIGNYPAAATHYDAAATIATAIGCDSYLTELTLQRAWLQLLTGATEDARSMVQSAGDQMTTGQWMSANIVLGVADLIDRAAGNGEELLTSALTYQLDNEAATAACAVRCYLAVAAFRNGCNERGQVYANGALRWLNEHHLAYLPYWWHPTLLAEWVAYALEHCPSYIHVLQQICVHHLQNVALAPLTELQQRADPALRLRAQRLLDAIQQSNFSELAFVQDDHIRAVLMQLVAEGKLRRAGLPLLFTKLTTAEHQRTPNPTLVSVFGLYLAGLPRETIVGQTKYSLPLVRNYINQIYARFGLSKEEWPKTTERKERLRFLAREAGFI
jgi:tetratricopeptide (TPR) repeat protein